MRALLTSFVDALYPPNCGLCGAALEGDGFACAEHALEVDRATSRCGTCAAELSPALADGETCAACRRHPPRTTRAACVASYGAPLREWVLAFKHGGRRDLAGALGALLAERLADVVADALLVPVPLHPLRRLERGYDQADLLATELARRTGARRVRALRRTRATHVQGSALALSRASNVAGAFVLRRRARAPLAGAAVWLVDDVLTSGATADECARVLWRAAAGSVGVAVLARASGA